jgi:hypothetical protein
MVIAGGITAGKASGQEGRLRCIATVLENDKRASPLSLAMS